MPNLGIIGVARSGHTRAIARASAYFALPSAFSPRYKNGVKHEYNHKEHTEQHHLQLFLMACLTLSAGVA